MTPDAPTSSLPILDLVVLCLYIVAVVAFGCWFVRKSGTTSEFMTAGGALPGWAVGLSIFGTYLSSNTFLGVPGKAFGANWNAFVFSLSLPIAAWVAVKYFVPFYRRSGTTSAYENMETRFGPWARTYAATCYLLTQIARMGSIMFGVAIGLRALTGWELSTIIIITGILVTLYTLLGGIEAVIWTDVTQSIVLMIGALLVLGVLLFDHPEGPAGSIQFAADNGKFSLGSFSPDLTTSTFWMVMLYGLFINLNNFGIDQSYIQRYHTTNSEAAAKRSVMLGALLYVPVSLVFFMIGSLLFSYYHAHPDMLAEVTAQVAAQTGKDAAELSPADIGDKVLPHFMTHALPSGAAGLIIAAIFAAAMSSVDTSLNSSATVILCDVYKRYINPKADERTSMRVLRISTVLWGIIGTGVALAMIGAASVLDIWWKLSGLFAGGMLGLFLLGLISRKANNAAAVTGVITGVLVLLWVALSPASALPEKLQSPFHANMAIVVGTLTIFLVGLLVSQFFGARKDAAS